MRNIFIITVVLAGLTACNFNAEHNKVHQQQFDEGMTEFHELFDYFFMTPR